MEQTALFALSQVALGQPHTHTHTHDCFRQGVAGWGCLKQEDTQPLLTLPLKSELLPGPPGVARPSSP